MKKKQCLTLDQITNSDNHLKLANMAIREGEYELAIKLYNIALKELPELSDTIKFNMSLAERKINLPEGPFLPNKPKALLRLDGVSNKFAHGWAIDQENPCSSVVLRVDLDNTPYSIVETHLKRDDVKRIHGGDGFSGFKAELSPYATYNENSIIKVKSLSHDVKEHEAHKFQEKPIEPILKGVHYKNVNEAAAMATHPNNTKYQQLHSNVSISVIILNLNGETVLEECIDSILKFNKAAEIIVIDHASTDNSVEVLKGFKNDRIKIITRDRNYSYSDSNNLGAKQAKGELLIFLNNDIILTSDSISTMGSIISQNEFGLLGIKLWDLPREKDLTLSNSEKIEQHLGVHFNTLNRIETVEAFELRGNSFFPLNSGILETPAVTAAMMAVRKELFLSAGGFSEKYFYGQEDVDFCIRFQRKFKLKIGVLLDHGAYHIRGLSRKELTKSNKNYITDNRKIIQKEQGPWLRRKIRHDAFARPGFWNQKPLSVAMIVSEISFNTDKADFFTAKELGDAFEKDKQTIVGYFDKSSNYDVSGYDIIIVYIDGFDPRKLKNVSPHSAIIGWARNWFDRWCERSWIEHYDIIYASSEFARDYMSRRLKRHIGLLRIAASNECLKNIKEDKKYISDYVFTGSYFESPREITSALSPEKIPFKFKLFGYNWEKLPKFGKYSDGPVSYKEIPNIYASTKLVIDDANIATKKWGAINCRVYDALAAGVLCITNNDIGAKEIFDSDFPVYSKSDLNEKITSLLEDEDHSRNLIEKYSLIVASEHTYEIRKNQILEDLVTHAKKIKISIKIAAPDFERGITWGDYYFAQELRRELEIIGYSTRIDCMDEWKGSRHLDDDVNIVLRGLSRFKVREDQKNIMWLISHPDLVCEEELRDYDQIFVASDFYTNKLKAFTGLENISPLLQASSFNEKVLDPKILETIPESEILFIGNSRNEYRDVVRWCIEENLPISVYGQGWEQFIPLEFIKGTHIENSLIPYYYKKSKIVINDHWEDMKRNEFISNRVMDVISVNGTILTDIPKNFEGYKNIYSYEDKEDFISKIKKISHKKSPQNEEKYLSNDISFSARAKEIDRIIQPIKNNIF